VFNIFIHLGMELTIGWPLFHLPFHNLYAIFHSWNSPRKNTENDNATNPQKKGHHTTASLILSTRFLSPDIAWMHHPELQHRIPQIIPSSPFHPKFGLIKPS
jgi:hypothetical protein